MLKALKDTLIVTVDKKELVSESGIIVPLSDEEQTYGGGTVISVLDVEDVSEGDVLLFDDCMTKRKFEYEGNECMKLFPEDIVCLVENDRPVPILNKLVIDENPEYEKSAGGIIIPEEYRNGTCFGKVISTGSGRIGLNGVRLPLDVLAGEIVLFSQWKKIKVTIKGKKFIIIREDSIIGIVENKDLNDRIEQEKWRI